MFDWSETFALTLLEMRGTRVLKLIEIGLKLWPSIANTHAHTHTRTHCLIYIYTSWYTRRCRVKKVKKKIMLYLYSVVTRCHPLPPIVTCCTPSSPVITRCELSSPITIRFALRASHWYQTRRNLVNSGEMLIWGFWDGIARAKVHCVDSWTMQNWRRRTL